MEQIGPTAKSGAVHTSDRDTIRFKYQSSQSVSMSLQTVQPCQHNHNLLFYSLPSTPSPPPPFSHTPPRYTPWTPATVPPMTVTTSTLPSTFPIPTPPLPPIQIAPFPSPPHPTNPQTFSTFPNPSISAHLMFRVQSLPSPPLSSSQINSPHPTHTPTTPITLFNSTNLQLPTNQISVPRVHTLCRHRHRHRPHRLPPMSPTMSFLLCPSHQRPALLPLPMRPLNRVALTHHTQGIA